MALIEASDWPWTDRKGRFDALRAGCFALVLFSFGCLIAAFVQNDFTVALVAKHWANLQRLMAGTEPKIGARKKA